MVGLEGFEPPTHGLGNRCPVKFPRGKMATGVGGFQSKRRQVKRKEQNRPEESSLRTRPVSTLKGLITFVQS
jgi:hypothetical protein